MRVISIVLHVCTILSGLKFPLSRFCNFSNYLGKNHLSGIFYVFTDIKGLNNVDRIQQYQNRLLDALMLYTSSHYPNLPTKFGELLLRLSEVQR